MRLLIQPGDGVQPIVQAIARAKRSVEIVIFRFDQREVERALANAVNRGVAVYALIAHTNRAGEDNLRKLETRLLGDGVTVARTADDLVRYHGKFMIVDRRDLYLLAFNLTHHDIEHSRSFGIVTSRRDLVREAVKLFEADSKRHAYEPGSNTFVVSPVNARKELAAFIKGARKELLVYDPEISDRSMVALLEDRAKAGVDVRIIGQLTRSGAKLMGRKLSGVVLHTRTLIRDGRMAFVGSQSLRELELDARREVGIIFREPQIVGRLAKTFQEDWAHSEQNGKVKGDDTAPSALVAKKVASAVARELPPVTPVVGEVVRQVVGADERVELDPEEVETAVRHAVKQAVAEVVKDAVEDAVTQQDGADT